MKSQSTQGPRRGRRNEGESLVGFIDRVGKGSSMLLLRNADVINMSYGWPPKANNSKAFQEIMAAAANTDAIFVAGAGNNNHSVPIFPCASESVICAGSIDIDGRISNFSNYGSHVDFLAPGQEIISLFANGVFEADFPSSFDVPGLGRKSGTSQSAPYISAISAVLKGLNPEISRNEIYARLKASSIEPERRDKYSLGGIVRLDRVIDIQERPVIVPILKGNNLVSVKKEASQLNFNYPIKIKNFWASKNTVTNIHVSFDNPEIHLDQQAFTIRQFEKDEVQTLSISGTVDSLKSKSTTTMSVTVDDEVFQRDLRFHLNLASNPNTRIFTVAASDEHIQIINANMRRGLQPLMTPRNPKGVAADPLYYIFDLNSEGLNYHFYSLEGDEIRLQKTVHLPQTALEIFIQRRDLNHDGLQDVIIGTMKLEKVEGSQDPIAFLQITYLNHQLEPLYAQQSYVVEDRSIGVPNYENSNFITINSEILGEFTTPVFSTLGPIPETDNDPDPFNLNIEGVRNRLFYFEPVQRENEVKLRKRSFVDYQFDNKIRSWAQQVIPDQRVINFEDDVELVTMLHQTEDQFRNNQVTVIASILEDTPRNCVGSEPVVECGPYTLYFALQLDGDSLTSREVEEGLFELADYGQYLTDRYRASLALDANRTELSGQTPTTDIFDERVEPLSSSAFYMFDHDKRTLQNNFIDATHPGSFLHSATAHLSDEEEGFEQFFASFKNKDQYYSLARSANQIYVLSTSNLSAEKRVSKIKIVASDFLPGTLSTTSFIPVVVGSSGAHLPGLYVKASEIYQNLMYTLILKPEGPEAPLGLNNVYDPECIEMEPLQRQSGEYSVSLFCRRGEQFTVELTPMTVDSLTD
ncbi:MAG: S8/S53 family peptidase [Bdellovibrionales bacterium]